ncbi:MAG: transporter substrate-binding domain-containing protein [Vulcanimicrobiaceae bacterium]
MRPGLTAQTHADLDHPGIKVVGVANTTTLRGAQRELTHNPDVVGIEKVDDIVAGLRAGTVDAFANLRDQLVPLSAQIPGSRVLPGAFQQTKTAVAVRLDHPAALAYVSAFVTAAKTNGSLRAMFDAHGLHDTPIAP